MIWHIFRKDWKLLWTMVVGAALITAIARMLVMFANGIFARFPLLRPVASLLETLSFVAIGVVIVMVVQHDALAGLRQDWLVRPIRRRDLLLSKIVFVVLAVQGPIFVFEFVQCLGSGFSAGESFTATISHSLWMLLALDLPVLAFATLTRNLAEAIGGGIAVGLGVAIFVSLHQVRSGVMIVNGPGVDWVTDSALVIWALAAAAIILALQYSRRRTNLSHAGRLARQRFYGCSWECCRGKRLSPFWSGFRHSPRRRIRCRSRSRQAWENSNAGQGSIRDNITSMANPGLRLRSSCPWL